MRSEVLDPEREDDKPEPDLPPDDEPEPDLPPDNEPVTAPEPDTLPEEPDLNPPDSGRTDGS